MSGFVFNPFTGNFDNSGNVPFTVSATAPASPKVGDLWWDTGSGCGFVFYDDGNTTQWVSIDSGAQTLLPAGSDTQVLFNDGGSAVGADAGLTFDKSTSLLSTGNVQVSQLKWQDEVGRIIVRGTGPNDPPWTQVNSTNFWAYSFSASTMMQFWITFHVRHDYAPGTVLYPHVHWFNPAATPNTGVVRWGFEWAVAAGYNTAAFPFGASTTKYVETTCSGTQYQHMISEVALADAIPATETDALICVRVFRDAAHANDTCTDAVMVPLVDIHYQTDDNTGTIDRNSVGAWSKV